VICTDFAGCFKWVMFAIYNDHNAKLEHNPEGNIKPFEDIFEQKAIPLDTLVK
jgi:hypothetical protein